MHKQSQTPNWIATVVFEGPRETAGLADRLLSAFADRGGVLSGPDPGGLWSLAFAAEGQTFARAALDAQVTFLGRIVGARTAAIMRSLRIELDDQ